MLKTSAHYVSQIIECCVGVGAEQDLLLACVPGGAERLNDPMERLDSDVLIEIYQVARESASEPSIGMAAGSRFNTSVLNRSGKLLPMCDNFGQAIQMLQRYHKVTQSFGVSTLEFDGDMAKIVWRPYERNVDKYAMATEGFLIGITAGARWLLWNAGQSFSSVEFQHECPTDPQRYAEITGCPVKFGRRQNALIFNKSLLGTSLPTSNPEGLDEMCRLMDRLLIQIDEGETIMERVYASIREQLHDGAPDLDKTASHLGLSIANLRYRLKLQKTSFRRIVQSVRQDICERELKRGRKMYLIAQKLGFHDQAAFNRAFKSWYGIAPKQYQTQVMREAGL